MQNYFDAQIAVCQEREAVLAADDRKDEAVFEKIRANVYDIFRTVWKLNRGDAFFQEKLNTIPQNWQTAYEKAREHGDTAAMALENIKLETVKEIQQRWEAGA